MKKFFLHFIFLIIVIGDLAGEFFQYKILDYSFKPLLLVWIAGYFVLYSKNIDRKVVQLGLAAFIFSWFGDVLLMFTDNDFMFFVLGLASFLIAQLMYINLFLRTINLSGKKPFLKKRPFWLIVYIAYGLIFYMILFSHLDAVLKVAVFLYMLALLGMSVMALNRYGNGHPVSFALVFAGSILFVLSDTMIATNTFITEIPYEGIFIMATYISAQFLIMKGILKQYE